MLGVLLTAIGTFFQEVSMAIGKRKVHDHEESRYAMGFLDFLFGTILFALIALVRHDAFVFSFASLPTFGTRLVLELVQLHYTLIAITTADRSTFSFIRVGTIPLLLGVDTVLGYAIGPARVIGITVIVLALLVAFMNHGIRRVGIGPVLFTTANAAATLSLFKYDITHFNSVAAEQLIVNVVLIGYCVVRSRTSAHEHLLRVCRQPACIVQSLASGTGSVVESFAYLFAPASMIVAAKRASAILWATASGTVVFHERRLLLKLTIAAILIAGITLLAV